MLFLSVVLAASPVCSDVPGCEKRCDAKDGAACLALAYRVRDGEGVAADGARADRLFGVACDLGVGEACRMFAFGFVRGPKSDFAHAVKVYEQGCRAKDKLCCSAVAEAYRSGSGVERDAARATAADETACELGELPACTSAGSSWLYGDGVARDVKKASALFTRACTKDQVVGCLGLAIAITDAKDPKALARAVKLLERACEGGVPAACAELSGRVATGLGTKADAARAVGFARMACKAGQPTGCFNLGSALMEGKGAAVDLPGAIEAFQIACRAEEPGACNAVGVLQVSEKNPARDVAAGMKTLGGACARGDRDACDNLTTFCKGGEKLACEAAPAAR